MQASLPAQGREAFARPRSERMKSRARKAAIASVAVCLPLALFAWGCVPQAPSAQTAGAKADAVEVAWSPGIDCASCHVEEASTSTDATCLAGHHATTQNLDCVTCHADESALADVHEDMNNGKVPKKLKKTSVDQALCLGCHDQTELAQKTASSTVLTDENGTVTNPHDLPSNSDHESVTCTSCHEGHATEPVQETAPEYCKSCHHENVYECGTCHE